MFMWQSKLGFMCTAIREKGQLHGVGTSHVEAELWLLAVMGQLRDPRAGPVSCQAPPT